MSWSGDSEFGAELYSTDDDLDSSYSEEKQDMEIFDDDQEGESDEEVEPPFPSERQAPHNLEPVDSPARSRSRSPHTYPSIVSCVEILYNGSGPEAGRSFREQVEDNVFLSPDVHEICKMEVDGVNESVPSRVRGRASVRGRARGHPGQVRGRRILRGATAQWRSGDPLRQIFLTDDDITPELREQVMSVIKARLLRADRVARQERNVGECSRERDNRDCDSDSEDEVFQDASDGRGDSFLDRESRCFEWFPMETFQTQEEVFKLQRTGSLERYESAYDAFRSYWTDDIIELVVTQSNLYASKIKSTYFQSEWYPTNAHEILCLFAFWMMLGIIRMPTITSCFSKNALLKTDVFRKVFSYRRYVNLVRALNYLDTSPVELSADPTIADSCTSSDRLCSLRPVLEHLNDQFRSNYIPSKDICIDESITLWRGKLDFKQCIRSKASKLFGIKSFELCDSRTGYLWSFLVDTGNPAGSTVLRSDVNRSTAVVLKLIEPLLHKGYRLFLDNYYNSPLLARYLKRNGTDCVGTLRVTREAVPPLLRLAPLKKGEFVARHSGDLCVLSWCDKKRISMLSTCHNADTAWARVPTKAPKRQLTFKPQMVLDYNRSIGGVDVKDQLLEPYLLERNGDSKWRMKLFKRLLNCSILNARILLHSSTKQHKDHLLFRLELVNDILKKNLPFIPIQRKQNTAANNQIIDMPFHTHWPVRIPQTPGDMARKRHTRVRCVVCLEEGRKLIKSPFKCETCLVALCMDGCFKKYHLRAFSS